MVKNKQQGQIVVILLLVIVVALGIGLSISTRSITEISTASKTEQSSRAFSAAEAGVEKALQDLQSNITGTRKISDQSLTLTNQADSEVTTTALLPSDNTQALEYGVDGIGKGLDSDSIAHVWLADPRNNLTRYYDQDNFDLYFGNPGQLPSEDNPAVEVIVVVQSTTGYTSKRYYFDSRARDNGFNQTATPTCQNTAINPVGDPITVNSVIRDNSPFFCRVRVAGFKASSSDIPVMVRVRMLYSNSKQKVAIAPNGTCGDYTVPCSIPPQIHLIYSTGSAGDVQRRLLLFKQDYVIPHLFDYVLFSAGDVNK